MSKDGVLKGKVIKLYLERITSQGDALGRFEGKPVFIGGGAPDETVLCRITADRKTWARAEILEITEPSPFRVSDKNETLLCKYSDSKRLNKCGGCNLSHISYEAQLKAKKAILLEIINKPNGLKSLRFSEDNLEVFPSPPREYRNRMQFHCFRENMKTGAKMKFGLMGTNKEIIEIDDCPVADTGIRQMLGNGGNIPLPPEKDRFNVFSKDGLFLNEGGVQKGKIKLLGKEIILDAGVFFQSNCFMLEKLILELQKIAQNADSSLPMADMYCGCGIFALFLGGKFNYSVLAEENKTSIGIARENMKGMKAEFIASCDTKWDKVLFHKKKPLGFAVADPPRAGLCAKFASSLAREGPGILAYVSCDPVSLGRDLMILTDGGYRLESLKIFDFYPQTAHIESLAVLAR